MFSLKFTTKETRESFLSKFLLDKNFELKTKNCNYKLDIRQISINHSDKTLLFKARLRECRSHNGLADATSNYYIGRFDFLNRTGLIEGFNNLNLSW